MFPTVDDTVENVREGVVLAIALGAVYLVIVTTVLGWWKPAIHEPRKVGSRWMRSIPVLLLLGAIANLPTTKWGAGSTVSASTPRGWRSECSSSDSPRNS